MSKGRRRALEEEGKEDEKRGSLIDSGRPILKELYSQRLIKPVSSSPVPCDLGPNGTLNLGGILSVFTESITEEHAWAVIYGCVKTLEEILSRDKGGDQHRRHLNSPPPILYLVTSPLDIFIHKDGRVHDSTFLGPYHPLDGSDRVPTSVLDKVIAELGEVIYTALDYGLTDEDERQLTPGLENLLDLMTSADDDDEEEDEDHRTIETDDEGIEQDHDEGHHHHHEEGEVVSSSGSKSHSATLFVTVHRVLDLCKNHLSVSKEAEHHFKNVCRALVSEALELSFFIERVQCRDVTHAKEIQELALLDWACLWKETMYQLRQGVKLKKTSYTKTPIEYELTPYEILMDDIRSRRYKLNKVMVNGSLPPKVKKDAHNIILEFIRSRPPLKPVSRRVLPPKKLDTTPKELLMKSICSPSARASLKKTSGPPSPKKSFLDNYSGTSFSITSGEKEKPSPSIVPKKLSASPSTLAPFTTNELLESSVEKTEKKHPPLKRVIKPDPSFLKFDPYNDDEDDFSYPLSPELKRPTAACPTIYVSDTTDFRRRRKPGVTNFDSNLSPIFPNSRISSPSRLNSDDEDDDEIQRAKARILKPKGISYTSTPNLSITEDVPSITSNTKVDSSLHRNRAINDWSMYNNCDLTLEEITHIRSVHTKAELENSTVESRKKSDIENAKLCFLCVKNYFGIFSWSYKCKLCKQHVCSSCLTKIKIPSDRFSDIPVKTLVATIGQDDVYSSSSKLEQQPPSRRTVRAFSSFSNLTDRKVSNLLDPQKEIEPSSLPLTPTSTKENRIKLRRSNTFKHERLSRILDGTFLSVCTGCKDVIQQIIKSQCSQNRHQMTRSLCLV